MLNNRLISSIRIGVSLWAMMGAESLRAETGPNCPPDFIFDGFCGLPAQGGNGEDAGWCQTCLNSKTGLFHNNWGSSAATVRELVFPTAGSNVFIQGPWEVEADGPCIPPLNCLEIGFQASAPAVPSVNFLNGERVNHVTGTSTINVAGNVTTYYQEAGTLHAPGTINIDIYEADTILLNIIEAVKAIFGELSLFRGPLQLQSTNGFATTTVTNALTLHPDTATPSTSITIGANQQLMIDSTAIVLVPAKPGTAQIVGQGGTIDAFRYNGMGFDVMGHFSLGVNGTVGLGTHELNGAPIFIDANATFTSRATDWHNGAFGPGTVQWPNNNRVPFDADVSFDNLNIFSAVSAQSNIIDGVLGVNGTLAVNRTTMRSNNPTAPGQVIVGPNATATLGGNPFALVNILTRQFDIEGEVVHSASGSPGQLSLAIGSQFNVLNGGQFRIGDLGNPSANPLQVRFQVNPADGTSPAVNLFPGGVITVAQSRVFNRLTPANPFFDIDGDFNAEAPLTQFGTGVNVHVGPMGQMRIGCPIVPSLDDCNSQLLAFSEVDLEGTLIVEERSTFSYGGPAFTGDSGFIDIQGIFETLTDQNNPVILNAMQIMVGELGKMIYNQDSVTVGNVTAHNDGEMSHVLGSISVEDIARYLGSGQTTFDTVQVNPGDGQGDERIEFGPEQQVVVTGGATTFAVDTLIDGLMLVGGSGVDVLFGTPSGSSPAQVQHNGTMTASGGAKVLVNPGSNVVGTGTVAVTGQNSRLEVAVDASVSADFVNATDVAHMILLGEFAAEVVNVQNALLQTMSGSTTTVGVVNASDVAQLNLLGEFNASNTNVQNSQVQIGNGVDATTVTASALVMTGGSEITSKAKSTTQVQSIVAQDNAQLDVEIDAAFFAAQLEMDATSRMRDSNEIIVDLVGWLGSVVHVGGPKSQGGNLAWVSALIFKAISSTPSNGSVTQSGPPYVIAVDAALEFTMTDETSWSLCPNTVLALVGGVDAPIGNWGDWTRLEIGGTDVGNIPAGFTNNFDLRTLRIGPGAHAYLQDEFDNGNRLPGFGDTIPEALYVDVLQFADAEGILNRNGLNIYFGQLIGDPAQIVSTPVPPPNPADITGDGVVNVNDLLAVINSWGPCPAPPQSCPADIAPAPNGDGVVNVNDLLMVINNWG